MDEAVLVPHQATQHLDGHERGRQPAMSMTPVRQHVALAIDGGIKCLVVAQALTALEGVDLLRKWSILLRGERSRRTGSCLCLGLSVDFSRPGRE